MYFFVFVYYFLFPFFYPYFFSLPCFLFTLWYPLLLPPISINYFLLSVEAISILEILWNSSRLDLAPLAFRVTWFAFFPKVILIQWFYQRVLSTKSFSSLWQLQPAMEMFKDRVSWDLFTGNKTQFQLERCRLSIFSVVWHRLKKQSKILHKH